MDEDEGSVMIANVVEPTIQPSTKKTKKESKKVSRSYDSIIHLCSTATESQPLY